VKILDRYIIRESLLYFALSLFVFTGILITARMLKFTSLIVNKGVDISQIAMVFLAITPTFLEIAIPMAALLGVMMAFARMSGDSEIVVIRSSGVSLTQLIKPVLVFGAAVSLLSFYVSLDLRPWGYRTLASTLFEIARTKSTAGLNEGVFNKLGHLTLYAEKIEHISGDLEKVLIDDKRDDTRRQVILAQAGKITSNKTRQTITIFLSNGVIHEVTKGGKYVVTEFNTNSLVMSPDEIYNPDAKKRDRRAREKTFTELNQQLEEYFSLLAAPEPDEAEEETPEEVREVLSGQVSVEVLSKEKIQKKINKLKIERGRRFSMPIATLLLALVAMPFGIQPPRTQKAWGATLSASLGMLVFIFYYGLLSLGIALAEGGTLPPLLGLWLPNIAVAVTAAYTLRKMGTEQWQSIVHGAEGVIGFFTRVLRIEAAPK